MRRIHPLQRLDLPISLRFRITALCLFAIPQLATAQVVITLNNSFIKNFKSRVTIDATSLTRVVPHTPRGAEATGQEALAGFAHVEPALRNDHRGR